MKTLLALIALSGSVFAAPPEAFWGALHQVETGGKRGAIIGDAGAALGPLQIHKAYHRDSRVAGRYEQVADLAYARKVAEAYLKRHARQAYERGDVVALARVHNGGPKGNQKPATLGYARRVVAAMEGSR